MKDKIVTLINRVERNNGNVTDIDCFKIIDLYTEVYGMKYTKLEREYEILYYYQELKKYIENEVD